MKASAITNQFSIRTNHTMTWNKNSNFISIIRHSNCTDSFWIVNCDCNIFVRTSFTIRNFFKSTPNRNLKWCSFFQKWQIKIFSFFFKIFKKLFFRLFNQFSFTNFKIIMFFKIFKI